MVAGFALGATGFVPGAVQTEEVKLAISATMSVIPLVTYGAGIVVFARFGLTRQAHAEVRRRLDQRR